MEVWKDIQGYEGLYRVSNIGRVKSLPRKCWNGRSFREVKGCVLRQGVRLGYTRVDLKKDDNKCTKSVHRLVATAFIPNPQNKPQVNHMNGVRNDNRVENLEWCTVSENALHSFRELGHVGSATGKFGKNHHRSKPVRQFSKNGVIIKEHAGVLEAQRETGVRYTGISACCNGLNNTAGGYVWRFKEDAFEKFSTIHKLSKSVIQCSRNDEFIAEYDGVNDASRKTGISAQNISKCCMRHKKYSHAGGFIWRYKV